LHQKHQNPIAYSDIDSAPYVSMLQMSW